MINPVIVDQINQVEKEHRGRQIAEIQLINQAYRRRREFTNPLKIALMIITRFSQRRPKQLQPQKAISALEPSEE